MAFPLDRTLSRYPSFQPACLRRVARPSLAVGSRRKSNKLWAAWPVRMWLASSRKDTGPSADGSQPPMVAHGLHQGLCIRQQAGDVVAGFRDDLFVLSPLGLDHDQAVQVGPSPVGVHVPGVFRCPERAAAARLNVPAVLLYGLMELVVAALEALGLLGGEGFDHGRVQRRLVALEHQHIVNPSVANGWHNPLPAAPPKGYPLDGHKADTPRGWSCQPRTDLPSTATTPSCSVAPSDCTHATNQAAN